MITNHLLNRMILPVGRYVSSLEDEGYTRIPPRSRMPGQMTYLIQWLVQRLILLLAMLTVFFQSVSLKEMRSE